MLPQSWGRKGWGQPGSWVQLAGMGLRPLGFGLSTASLKLNSGRVLDRALTGQVWKEGV